MGIQEHAYIKYVYVCMCVYVKVCTGWLYCCAAGTQDQYSRIMC